jgi:hypothetical protein
VTELDIKEILEETQHPLNLFEGFIRRPKMYTINGTYEEVVALIWGTWIPVENEQLEAWRTFQEWLIEDLGLTGAPAFRLFRDRFSDDESAKQGLIEKMAEFRKAQIKAREA